MKSMTLTIASALVVSSICFAQVGGNSVYGQRQIGGALAAERAKRVVGKDEMPTANSMYLDASVLINVKADEFVAVFGLSQEGTTLAECNQKMDATLNVFTSDLKKLGVGPNDVYVDFVAQNRIFGYDIIGDLAREKLTGFELKKTISIHYRAKTFLDQCIAAAARAQVFDLVKVDYIVKDVAAVLGRLMAQATQTIKRKAANHERLLGIKIRPPMQVLAERYSAYYPTDMYESYDASESEDVQCGYLRQNHTVQKARRSRTFYFNALDAKTFDQVVNPVVIEPVVQFTLYLKVKVTISEPKPLSPPMPAKKKSPRA